MEVNPTVPQDRFIFSDAIYPAFVGGFGSGKTEALIVRAILGKIKYPQLDRAFYEPTYDLIRMIAWPRFEEILSNLQIPYRLTKHPVNTIDITGYGRMVFRSMDTPSRIIGYEVGDSDVDELDTLKRDDAAEVWRRIVSRNRQKKPDGEANTIAVATTPEGFRFVYETWEEKRPPGYELIRAPTSSNPHLPEGYIESLRAIYPPHLLDAYLEGLFVNLTSGTVYVGFNRRECNSADTEQAGEPLFVGMDFNVGNMAAVIHVKRAGKPVAVAEITKGYDTPDMCQVLKRRFPDHAINVFPDASGGSRKSNNAAETDLRILRQAGFSVFAHAKNPRIRDRINAMNAGFAKGGYRVNVDRCPNYVRCLEQQAYNDKGEPDKAQGLDHLCFSGDTLVTTASGVFRFDEIPNCGYVLSPIGGMVAYHSARKTGRKVTARITLASGYVVECTRDHLFLTGSGTWVKAEELLGRECVLSVPHDRSSWGRHFFAAGSIFRTQGQQASVGCIERFGWRITGQYRPGFTSIIWTAIAETTRSRIWRAFMAPNISAYTAMIAAKRCGRWLRNIARLPSSGTAPMPAGNGTGSITQRPSKDSWSPMRRLAAVAESHSLRQEARRARQLFIAAQPVNHTHAGRAVLTMLLASANNAKWSFRRTDTTHVSVVTNVTPLGERDVYCLTVPDFGAFKLGADSPVVSNCDAGGYFMHYEYPVIKPAMTINMRMAT